MSASFVKYCPLCGHANLSISSFCEECDADLMNVPVEMRREEGGPPSSSTNDVGTTPVAGVSLENSTPERNQNPNDVATKRADMAPSALELSLVSNPAVRFSVRPGQSVGRASKADVVLSGVPDLEYISRAHARFIQRRSQWYVQYIAEGNSITVDGIESRDSAELALYDGSIVVLSFTAFQVKLS